MLRGVRQTQRFTHKTPLPPTPISGKGEDLKKNQFWYKNVSQQTSGSNVKE